MSISKNGAGVRGFLTLGLLALITSGLTAQSANSPAGSLTINTLDGAAPNTLQIVPPLTLDLEFRGNPNVPFILAYGPQVSVNELVIAPGESLDVGPFAQVDIVADGIVPTTFLDYFANTGANGVQNLLVNAPTSLPNGSIGAVQALMIDPTLPAPFVTFTAATDIVVVQPCDYGTVSFLSGPLSNSHQSMTADGGTGMLTPNAVPSADYDIENIALARFENLVSNLTSPGPINRNRPATAARPTRQAQNSLFPHIKTIWGDLYHYEDRTTSPAEFGYMISPGNGMPNVDLPFTRITNPGGSISPWETEVNISPDSTVMTVVYDPSGGFPDQIFMIRLDGGTFTLNGMGIIDVTPVGANATIAEDSMRFCSGKLYFTDNFSGGTFYSVDMDPTGVATPVTIPNLGTGNTPTIVDSEVYLEPVFGDLYFQAGVSTTEEDVYRIDGTGSGTIFNLTSFATATEVEEFGDSWDSADGNIDVSPTGLTFGFVTRAANADIAWIGSSFLAFAPIQIGTPANFASDQDTIVDLHVIDDDSMFWFQGTTSSAMDLYHYRISTATVTNITQTSGQTVAPFGGTPGMDPDGYFTWGNHLVFARDGTLTLGPSSGTSAANFVGVDYTNLLPINITGDEFFGPTTPNSNFSSPNGTEIVLAEGADVIWFFAPLASGGNYEAFMWDPNTLGPATQVTSNGATGTTYDNLTLDTLGTQALVSVRGSSSSSDEEIALLVPGSGATTLTNNLSNVDDITDGSIRFLDAGAPCSGFLFAQGTTSSSTAADSILVAYDFGSASTTVIDATPAYHWIFSVGN